MNGIGKIEFKSTEHICELDWYIIYQRCRSKEFHYLEDGCGYSIKCRKYGIICRDTTCPDLGEERNQGCI